MDGGWLDQVRSKYGGGIEMIQENSLQACSNAKARRQVVAVLNRRSGIFLKEVFADGGMIDAGPFF